MPERDPHDVASGPLPSGGGPDVGKPSTAELAGVTPRKPMVTAPTVDEKERARLSDPENSYARAPGEPSVGAIELAVGEADLEGVSERYDDGPLLGSGGMGEVRLQRDRHIGRAVAVKTMHSYVETPDTKQRFLREARVQGQLEHPAIVPVYDLGRKDGRLYFTMKRVRGLTLSRILHGLHQNEEAFVKKFPRRRLIAAMLQVSRAIHYAHTRGVVHRDLKPSNVMIGDFGEVYVLDWGLSREMVEAVPSPERRSMVMADPSMLKVIKPNYNLTKPGNLVGTLSYMAPEQARGETIDGRADIYALGVILFEILTLKRFRDDANYVRVVAMIVDGIVARPSDHVADMDPGLDEICVKATQVERDERYQTAEEVSLALERWLDGERDASTKRALAARHVAKARELLGSDRPRHDAMPEAMHEALRAMALEADHPDAQRILVDVLSDTSGQTLPHEAEKDIEESRAREAREGNLTIAVSVALMLGMPLIAAAIVYLRQPILAVAVAVLTLAVVFLFLNTVSRLRGRLDDAERRAAMQAWHLKQLFPATLRERSSKPNDPPKS
ncbi:MAG: serine/threonine protein kinase [Sandaracinaceae bacterium]|nr:serine/threonine protein kinase [Sandaracinaceae bacterium]